jgi:hypothetical protein
MLDLASPHLWASFFFVGVGAAFFFKSFFYLFLIKLSLIK